MELTGSGFRQIEATLVARERMQSAISSNIANAETPNFQADQRKFADFLSDQLAATRTGHAAVTHRNHFADIAADRNGDHALSLGVFQHRTPHKMDGNSVDIQQEMARMSENQLMHELSMRLVKGKINGLMNAIKEGNR